MHGLGRGRGQGGLSFNLSKVYTVESVIVFPLIEWSEWTFITQSQCWCWEPGAFVLHLGKWSLYGREIGRYYVDFRKWFKGRESASDARLWCCFSKWDVGKKKDRKTWTQFFSVSFWLVKHDVLRCPLLFRTSCMLQSWDALYPPSQKKKMLKHKVLYVYHIYLHWNTQPVWTDALFYSHIFRRGQEQAVSVPLVTSQSADCMCF